MLKLLEVESIFKMYIQNDILIFCLIFQAMLNWVLSKRAQEAASGMSPPSPDSTML